MHIHYMYIQAHHSAVRSAGTFPMRLRKLNRSTYNLNRICGVPTAGSSFRFKHWVWVIVIASKLVLGKNKGSLPIIKLTNGGGGGLGVGRWGEGVRGWGLGGG